ncbi:MAG TPA: hypothetical protein PL166_14920 [Candidatus Contendobacter sp.]|nr:hypothetical protein [Candidatus Contendobacter sp.]
MTLRYARDQKLGPWLDLVAAKGEVFVQFGRVLWYQQPTSRKPLILLTKNKLAPI